MEKLKVTLKLDENSSLIVGGSKLANNYISSKDYIQGSVIRAAFARKILDMCPVDRKRLQKEKRNWIEPLEQEACKDCCYKTICEKFSDIKFSFFYPVETWVTPLTSKICKMDKSHGFIDLLTQDDVCAKCGKRVEFVEGLRTKEGRFKATRLVQTKTAINPYTQTARDGQLFNLESIVDLSFEGEIENITPEEIKMFRNLRVGAYTSTGYGKCILEISGENIEVEKTFDKVSAYSKSYKQNLLKLYIQDQLASKEQEQVLRKQFEKEHLNKKYIVLLLTADLRVHLPEKQLNPQQDYKAMWYEALDLPMKQDVKIKDVYFDTRIYRGYDTSKNGDDYRAEMYYQISKGGIIVLEVSGDFKACYEAYKKGITLGLDTINGYGKCEIYCGEEV
ncbi:hypothetical protein [Cellulosilyticum ruminicola]|uniref:hypothetical protein n=1 Tax=Cellulosilyticum ruminicola TaxID=425254 RepID=UPI0006CFEBBC|nr:hypothetical protein [Cellulosilyticum ruminicola]